MGTVGLIITIGASARWLMRSFSDENVAVNRTRNLFQFVQIWIFGMFLRQAIYVIQVSVSKNYLLPMDIMRLAVYGLGFTLVCIAMFSTYFFGPVYTFARLTAIAKSACFCLRRRSADSEAI